MKTEIKSIDGKVLFEHDCEDNTIRKTLEEAVRRGANLVDAYLGGANLGGANLVGANLRGANLRGANLVDWGKIQSLNDTLIVGAIGSRKAYTTLFHTDKGIFVQCGCFRGSLEDFEGKVKQTHKGNKHEKDYLAMIEFAKIKFAE